jgi:tetratricopeptide (TPR) repeat protein
MLRRVAVWLASWLFAARPIRVATHLLCRGVSSLLAWIWSGWRQPVVALGLVAGAGAGVAVLRGHGATTWLNFWSVVAIALLLSAAVATWNARTRVIVDPLTDFTGAKSRPDARGVSTVLVHSLARLHGLYQFVDEASEITTAAGDSASLRATLRVEDLNDFLESASTTESKVSLGPVAIPIGMIFGLFGRLARGPRLAGSIHLEGDRVILSAQLTGGARFYSWQVETRSGTLREALDAEGKPVKLIEVPHALVEELAVHVFTDLALRATLNPTAAGLFLDALESMRTCLRTQRDQKLALLAAERKLMEALSEDSEIALAHYNLGVVYQRLSESGRSPHERRTYFRAAERAYKRQLELRPDRWEAYFALAHLYFNAEPAPYGEPTPDRLTRVIALLRRVVELRPAWYDIARAYALEGLVERQFDLARALRTQRRAVGCAWVSLCLAELRRSGSLSVQTEHVLAARSLSNFAVARAFEDDRKPAKRLRWRSWWAFWRICVLLKHASALAPFVAWPPLQLGKIALARGRVALSIRQLEEAALIEPENAAVWAQLAEAQAESAVRSTDEKRERLARDTRASLRQALTRTSCTSQEASDTLARVAGAYQKLGDEKSAELVKARQTFYDDAARASGTRDEEALHAMVERSRTEEDAWGEGIAEYWWAMMYLTDDPLQASSHFERAISKLEGVSMDEIRRLGIHALRARALVKTSPGEALSALDTAVGFDPLSSFERNVAAEVFFEIGDLKQARDAWEKALLWEPNNPEFHEKLARCHWLLAADSQDPERRNTALEATIRHYRHALDLYGIDQREEKMRARYWIALSFKELERYEEVAPHLGEVLTVTEAAPLVNLLRGEAYFRNCAYDAAEGALLESIAEARRRMDEDDANWDADVGLPLGDEGWPLAVVLAYAENFCGFVYAERDVRLHEARACARRAGEVLDHLDPDEARTYRAVCEQVEGLALFKLGQLEDAVAAFERSLALASDSEVYLQLATTAAERAVTVRSKAEQRRWRRRARAAAEHSAATDVTGRYRDRATELIASLDRLAATASVPLHPVQANGDAAHPASAGATPPV